MDFFQKRSDPPPWILELLGHFFESPKFWNFWGTNFWQNSPNIWAKSAQKLLDLVNPPPFSTKSSKMLVHKKCPKTFGSASDPPPTYWRSPKERCIFLRSSLMLHKLSCVVDQESLYEQQRNLGPFWCTFYGGWWTYPRENFGFSHKEFSNYLGWAKIY